MKSFLALLLTLSSIACSVSHAAAAPPERNTPAPAPIPHEAAERPRGRVVGDVRPEDYAAEKIVALVRDFGVQEGNFLLGVVPMTHRLTVASRYPKWIEKRYSPEDMASLIQQETPSYRGQVIATLTLIYLGDMFSPGEHDLELPDDLAEYIFLENDRGQSVRCTRAELPLLRLVNPFSQQVDVNLFFSGAENTHPDFFETKTLTFVVGGLGFERNTITFPYPLDSMLDDAPEPLQGLYTRSGL